MLDFLSNDYDLFDSDHSIPSILKCEHYENCESFYHDFMAKRKVSLLSLLHKISFTPSLR